MVAPEHVTKYRDQASHVTHQQHLQMGLRKGMAILVYYVVESTRYQVVLLAQESVLRTGGKSENRLWKRVTPYVTEFAWLPPAIAESFCGKALYRDSDRVYFPFNQPHLGLGTKDFDGPMVIEDIFYLGDTRSADDLAVFTGMPDLFYWQGHLLDGIRVTLNFGVNCLELASEHFIYARFNYPTPGLTPPLLEDNGWTVVPESGSYFFSRASLSLGHLHPSQSGVIDPSDPLRPPNLLKWPATSPVTRSHVAHLPMHGNPTAPPSFLPASAIHFFHMGLTRLCEQEVLQDPQLNHAAWLAAFAALTGTDLTTEHLALLQHPSIPGQFPSKVFATLQAGHQEPVKEYVSEIISCTGPSWAVKKNRPRSTGSQTPPDDAAIQELPRTTRDPLPAWVPFSPKRRISRNLPKAGSSAPPCAPITAPASRAISTPIPAKLSTLTPSRSQAKALHRLLPMNSFAVWSPRTTSVAGIVSNWAGLLRAKPPPPPNWSYGASAVPSTTSSRDIPLTLEQAEPYAIYFFQSSML